MKPTLLISKLFKDTHIHTHTKENYRLIPLMNIVANILKKIHGD
jgi:hypothetical protein